MINTILKSAIFTLLISLIVLGFPGRVFAAPVCSLGTTVNIVAHEDDDILFLSPDLLHDIQSGRCVTTVYLTAGDDNRGSVYWRARENGSQAAYAQMSAVADNWTQSAISIQSHSLVIDTLTNHTQVSLIYLRLPDGNIDGSGFSNNNHESLQKLLQGNITTMHQVDGSTGFTKSDLITTLTGIMNQYQPDIIRTQDYVNPYSVNDHSDHTTTANFALSAHQNYLKPHTFIGYMGYPITSQPVNVSRGDATAKAAAFLNYATYDTYVCQTLAACQQTSYGPWLVRQYKVGSVVPIITYALTSTVVEFYNTILDNYFITANASEAAAIGGGAGPGWSRTGNSFKSGGNTSVCRFYGSMSPGPNSHFYTVDAAECQSLKNQQIPAGDPRKLMEKSWNFESLDFVSTPATNQTCPSGTTPVYRAYNNGFVRGVDSNHRITSSQTAIQQVVTRGWSNEGVVMCAPN